MPYKISIVNQKFVGNIAQTKHVQIIFRYINVRLPLIQSSGPMFKKTTLDFVVLSLIAVGREFLSNARHLRYVEYSTLATMQTDRPSALVAGLKSPPPPKIKRKLKKFDFFYYFAIVSLVKWYKRQWTLFE